MFYPGSAAGPHLPRPEPDGAGGDRHDQHHRSGRPGLLPRVLPRGAGQVQGGGRGAVLSDHVQSETDVMWLCFK